jgi:hypothetical protein
VGKYSIIYTARRLDGGWQGVARIKPSIGAPQPFTETGSYASHSTFRGEAAAEIGTQKEVAALMQRSEREGRALDSLVAESKMRNVLSDEDLPDDAVFS